MSVKLMSAIFETEFRDLQDADGNITKASTAKSVLLALADHANDEGEGAYPGLTKMQTKTALSRQSVINTYDALKYNGLIYLEGKSKLGTNDYTININSFPGALERGQPGLLVISVDQGGQPALPVLVKPVDPNHPLTTQEPQKGLSEKDHQQVNAKVDAIIAASSRADWHGREIFLPDHLPLMDWYHTATGQDCPKAKRKDWMKAAGDWAANNLTVADLQAAYDMDLKWRGVFTSPNQLTDKAIALRAQKQARPEKIEYLRQL